MRTFETVALVEEARIGQVKRIARRCASDTGLSERQMAEIDIAVKEIGSNAMKFARGTGQLFVARMDSASGPEGVELIYVDKGPGIEDSSLAVKDGFTTTGSLGAGLGAIKRMADEFYIYSNPQSRTRPLALYGRTHHGTAMVFRKYLNADEAKPKPVRETWGTITRPVVGADFNGDAYFIKRDKDQRLVAIIDGLGHGLGARDASKEALTAIEENYARPLEYILRATHEALRQTRGAVAGLARIDCSTGVIEYTGIGNTDFRVLGGRSIIRLISLNGTLGSRLERIKVFKEQLPKVATIVLTTDGISDRWDAESYPGLLGAHPQLLSAVIMRDYSRSNDDATILCGRINF